MKKIVAILSVLALSVTLMGCSGGSSSSSGSASATSTASESTPAPATSSSTTEAAPQQAPEPSVPTEYENALKQAKLYLKSAPFSYQGLFDQLTSEYGSQFPEDAARYAVDNCGADWNAEALEAAETYYKQMSMSKSAIYDQLISEYGNQFTPEQAQYAVDHLE